MYSLFFVLLCDGCWTPLASGGGGGGGGGGGCSVVDGGGGNLNDDRLRI